MSKGLEAIEEYKKITCIHCQYDYGNKCNNEGECFSKIIEKELKAFEIIKEFNEIEIDLRDETQMSLITIGNKIFTISYKNAKLLKEVLL